MLDPSIGHPNHVPKRSWEARCSQPPFRGSLAGEKSGEACFDIVRDYLLCRRRLLTMQLVERRVVGLYAV